MWSSGKSACAVGTTDLIAPVSAESEGDHGELVLPLEMINQRQPDALPDDSVRYIKIPGIRIRDGLIWIRILPRPTKKILYKV